MRWGTAAALLAATGALTLGLAAPATAGPGAPPTVWSPDLLGGESAGIVLVDGTARLDPATAFLAPADDGATTEPEPVPTGLLTFASRILDAPSHRVGSAVLGEIPDGTTATVDVRGRRAVGTWTEWLPARPGPDGPAAELPEPVSEVQSRLVLTAGQGASPAVSAVTLTASPTTSIRLSEGSAEQAPLAYRVFATREGLAGATTANGHVIAERDHFVALPSRRALAPRDSGDYSVKVCAAGGRCAFAPVWDVGPWNTRDDYWNPSTTRQSWPDLPQGVPQAQAAHEQGYNGGKDQYDRSVANPAGIDLGDGVFWDALGLTSNAWVTVDYLWTGAVPLVTLATSGPVLAAPDAAAAVVGFAAAGSGVPVECVVGSGGQSWLRIGVDQYLAGALVPDPGAVGAACDPPTALPVGCDVHLGPGGPPAPAVPGTPTDPALGGPGDTAGSDEPGPGSPVVTGDPALPADPAVPAVGNNPVGILTGPASPADPADPAGPAVSDNPVGILTGPASPADPADPAADPAGPAVSDNPVGILTGPASPADPADPAAADPAGPAVVDDPVEPPAADPDGPSPAAPSMDEPQPSDGCDATDPPPGPTMSPPCDPGIAATPGNTTTPGSTDASDVADVRDMADVPDGTAAPEIAAVHEADGGAQVAGVPGADVSADDLLADVPDPDAAAGVPGDPPCGGPAAGAPVAGSPAGPPGAAGA